MTGSALGFLVLVLVGSAGALTALLVGVRSFVDVVLAAYVLAFAELVALALFLSLFESLTRTGLLLGAAAILAGAIGLALWVGVPRPSLPSARTLTSSMRSGPVRVLAIVTALAFGYVIALIVGTPPNGWDPLNYHLVRAASWLQSGQIGYVESAYDERINFNPPNAEIAISTLLGVARHERIAGVVQLAAAAACAGGVFALARRIDCRRAEAMFGALLFVATPIVMLQASTAKNDVVVASFLIVAAVFVVRPSYGELGIATVATALAVGTKFTAAYGLAILAILALVAEPRAQRLRRLLALLAGGVAGTYWYVVNLVESDRLLGDQSNVPGLTAPLHPRENLVTGFGLVVDFVDLSGAVGADIFVFLVVGVGLTTALLSSHRRRGGVSRRDAILAGSIVLVVFPLYALTTYAGRPTLLWLHGALGDPQAYLAETDEVTTSPATASDTGSWFGPAGVVLVVGIAIAAIVLARRGKLSSLALVTAASPAVALLLVAATLTYHPWQGRFFVFPVALSASLWGIVLRVPAIAWAMTALVCTTTVLSLVHFQEKPSGVRLLERQPTTSVWAMDRSMVQSLHDPALEPLVAYVEGTRSAGAALSLALGANEFGFPFFDPTLERRVVLLPFGSSGADVDADWLVANPGRASEVDRACWREELTSQRGVVFSRAHAGCAG